MSISPLFDWSCLPVLADDEPVEGDGDMGTWMTRAGGPERACYKSGHSISSYNYGVSTERYETSFPIRSIPCVNGAARLHENFLVQKPIH